MSLNAPSAAINPTPTRIRVEAQGVSVFYDTKQALHNVSMRFAEHTVTALIGPSGCGKSTFLRCFNRMNDTISRCRITGSILLDGQDIYAPTQDVVVLRSRIGMVFQKPNPFPKSIFDNVAYGVKLHGMCASKAELDGIVEQSLQRTGLWNEVRDRLHQNALGLSGGQQQRLCIARAIAVRPEVVLMDEPCSALDPLATGRIEELIAELKDEYTIIIVTHSMQQARRVSDFTGFFHLGHVEEYGTTEQIFESPTHPRTRDYIQGRYG